MYGTNGRRITPAVLAAVLVSVIATEKVCYHEDTGTAIELSDSMDEIKKCKYTGKVFCGKESAIINEVSSIIFELAFDGCVPRLCYNQAQVIESYASLGESLNVSVCVMSNTDVLPVSRLPPNDTEATSSPGVTERGNATFVVKVVRRQFSSIYHDVLILLPEIRESDLGISRFRIGSGPHMHDVYLHLRQGLLRESASTSLESQENWYYFLGAVALGVADVLVICILILVVVVRSRKRRRMETKHNRHQENSISTVPRASTDVNVMIRKTTDNIYSNHESVVSETTYDLLNGVSHQEPYEETCFPRAPYDQLKADSNEDLNTYSNVRPSYKQCVTTR